jgi:hypothetical protein
MPPPLLSFETTATDVPPSPAASGGALRLAYHVAHSSETKIEPYWNETKTDACWNETKTDAHPTETKTKPESPPTTTLGRRNRQ